MKNRSLALLALAALALSGCSHQSMHERLTKELAASGVRVVHIRNSVGRVEITGSNRSTVLVNAVKNGHSLADLAAITIEVHRAGDEAYVTTRYASGAHSGGVNYSISVPSGVAIDLENSIGQARIRGITGDVTEHTSIGDVMANLGAVRNKRNLDFDVTTGDLRLTIAKNSDATVDAQTTIGAIDSDLPLASDKSGLGTNAQGKIGTGSATIKLRVSTGRISLNS